MLSCYLTTANQAINQTVYDNNDVFFIMGSINTRQHMGEIIIK